MIDTHAHMHDKQYDDDREATIDRARAAGVDTIVTIGCDLADSARAIRTAETYGLLATVGIHPHEAVDAPDDIATAFDELRAGASAPVVAIGETGLDYHYNHSPADDQRRVLRAQIAYAKLHALPVVFHQREAFDDFVSILRDVWDPATMRGVIHCFTGNATEAKTFVTEFNLLLGIGGVVTFKNAEGLRDACARRRHRSDRDGNGLPVSCAATVSRQAQRAGVRSAERTHGCRHPRARTRRIDRDDDRECPRALSPLARTIVAAPRLRSG